MAVTPEVVAHSLEQAALELCSTAEDNRDSDLYFTAMLTAGYIAGAVINLTGRTAQEQIEKMGRTYLGIADGDLQLLTAKFN